MASVVASLATCSGAHVSSSSSPVTLSSSTPSPPLGLACITRWTTTLPISTTLEKKRLSKRGNSSTTKLSIAPTQDDDDDDDASLVSPPMSPSEVVKSFYSAINKRQLDFVEELIAEDCVYEDLVFAKPFVGNKAILDFFRSFTDSVGSDLCFVIDDISNNDSAIGVTWHLEWRGKPFPFSKGCSFYRCEIFNGKQQIIYARDCVEPATKPGSAALVAINAVTFLLERFPWLADRF